MQKVEFGLKNIKVDGKEWKCYYHINEENSISVLVVPPYNDFPELEGMPVDKHGACGGYGLIVFYPNQPLFYKAKIAAYANLVYDYNIKIKKSKDAIAEYDASTDITKTMRTRRINTERRLIDSYNKGIDECMATLALLLHCSKKGA